MIVPIILIVLAEIITIMTIIMVVILNTQEPVLSTVSPPNSIPLRQRIAAPEGASHEENAGTCASTPASKSLLPFSRNVPADIS